MTRGRSGIAFSGCDPQENFMAQWLFIYHGGGKPATEAAANQAMLDWGNWFEGIGARIVDGGKPVGQSTTVQSDGSVLPHGGSNPVSGYGVFEAANLEEAVAIAKGCPILKDGGSVEIAETFDP
jgi:hypothetical protein